MDRMGEDRQMTTPYFCPSCRYSGVVAHPDAEYPAVIARKIHDDHCENAPHCKADVREIQIGDLAPDGD